MLLINSSVYQIDTKFFEDNIGIDGFDMYIDVFKYYAMSTEFAGMFKTAEILLREFIERITCGMYHDVSPSVIRVLLTRYFSADSLIGLRPMNSGNVSIDKEKVIKPLKEAALKRIYDNPVYYGDIVEFCNLYLDYSSLKNLTQTAESKKKLLMETDLTDNLGSKLCTISSMYIKQSTGRYYTNSDNLQGWNLKIVPAFTAPKDYYLVWADFDQIDLRVAANLVLFNGHPEMVKEFDETPDKYEAIAKIICKRLNKPFDLEKFKANRKAYKRAVLARLYGASMKTMMSSGFTDTGEISMLNDYYNSHQYYQEYIESFRQAIAFEAEVCIEDYFGFERRIAVSGKNYGGRNAQVLESCLNTPIQSTSNDIVMLWVNEVTKRFRDLGFGKDKFRVALLRHDEAIFLVHKDCTPHTWLFKYCSSIFIDKWSELTIEPEFGYNYKQPNEALYKSYEESISNNLIKINNNTNVAKSDNKKWSPCKKTIHLQHIAPVSPAEFAYYLLLNEPSWSESVHELGDMFKNREDARTIMNFAVNIIHEYQKSPDANNSVLKFIDCYNKYFSTFITSPEPHKFVKISKSNLINYLESNGCGYVYIHNALCNNYVVYPNGIQMRFIQDESLDVIVERIENSYGSNDKG